MPLDPALRIPSHVMVETSATVSNTTPVPGNPSLCAALPNYNHARYLPHALDALLSQSRPPDEIIFLDDGSTDDSVTILKKYAEQHPGVRLLRNAKNEGVLPSLNKLLGEARSDFIYIAAADDYVLPGFFETAMLAAAPHPEVGVIFGDFETFSNDGRIIETTSPVRLHISAYLDPEAFLRDYLLVEPPHRSPGPVSIFNRRLLVETGGYKEEVESWADAFAVRELGLRQGACYIKHLCGRFRYDPLTYSGSLSNRPDKLLRIIRRTARLMRSGENKRYFPADHVRQWQADFLGYAAELSSKKYSGDLSRQMSLLKELIRASTPSKSVERLIYTTVLKLVHAAAGTLGRRLIDKIRQAPPPGSASHERRR